ncbi:uncharacterized protein LOC144145317 [Haemaphysalis longicornis]
MISMLSAEIHRWNIICACVLCIAFFLDLLTVYVSTAFVVLWSGVNYYLYKRDENFRHRLSILGLIKHDKREQRRRSEHNSSKRAVYTGSVTPTSGTPSRLGCASFDYLRVTPGNKFDTPSRVLQRGEVDNGEHRLVSPVFMSKTPLFNRSCQSSFASDHARKPQLDWVPAATRRLPAQQEKYPAGSYPVVCLNKSPLPLARPFASPELIAPVRVKILPLATSHIHNTFSQLSATSDADKQDPCSTESVIQALKERRKRAAAAAYQDSLDAACHSPSQAQSSKRPRRDPLCAVPLPPPFTPVATSVGGFGPPYLGSPSKNAALVRPPMPSGLGPMPEGPFKRGRLPSSSSPPASGGKRHKNNAIAVSYCSSRSIRLQRSQSQKRKAMPPDPSPLSKLTKKEERKLQADEGEGSGESAEDSSKENNAPSEASEPSTETRETDSADTTKQRSRVRPIDWSTIQKKKLVYPEHMATLKEHENDQALDRERLNRLLGSLQDTSEIANGEMPGTTAEASVSAAPVTSLPFFPTPSTVTTAAPLQSSTTNTVSVISSPVMSVSSTMASSSPKPTDGITVTTPAVGASTPIVSAASATSAAPASTKPQFGAGFFSLSSPASQSATSTATPSTLLPTTALSTTANPLLAGLASVASPKTTTTAVSTLSTPFQLPAVMSPALPAPSASSSVSTTSSAPSFTTTAAKPDQPTGGFVFSGPSLGGNVVPKAPPSSPAFGAPAATVTGMPATLPTFTANNASVATSSAAAPALPGSTPFQFGSSIQAAAAQPFKFGSGDQPAASTQSSVAAASSTQAPATSSLQSGVFKFGAAAPASQITPLSSQAPSVASTNMFNFGSGNTTAKLATVTAVPAFGSTTMQSPLGAAAGIGAQPNNGGFTFGAATTAQASVATATSPNFAFGSSNPAASTGTAPFKFGAQAPMAGAATPLVPAATTAASALTGAPFAFGAPTQKSDAMQPAFAFGAATTTTASSGAPFAFGAAPTATATTPFAFGAPATTNTSGTPFAFGGASATGGTPDFPQSSATSPLFPSAAPLAQTAQTGGFQFGAPAAGPQGVFGAATNGLSNGISTNTASQPGGVPQGLFKFGATNNNASMPGFNFNAGTTPKPAFNFGGAPVMTPANNLFSIGTASSNSERPIARPRSKRVVKK